MTLISVLPVLSLVLGIVSSMLLRIPLFAGILFAILVTLACARHLGHPLPQQLRYGWEGVQQTKPVLILLFLVGLLIPLLMMGGTIPAIIYYGLSVVNVEYLLVLSFMLTTIVSCMLGTSIGTLSTIGLSLLGIAHAADVPLGMMAGALISGAMVGERFSPISSSRLLVLSSVELGRKPGGKINRGAVLAVAFSAGLFLMLDAFRTSGTDAGSIDHYLRLIEQHFSLSVVPLLPLIVLVGSLAFRIKAIPSLFNGVLTAGLLVLFLHPPGWETFFRSVITGYELHSQTKLDELVRGGGMKAILQVLLVISLAGFMNGILNKVNLLAPLVDRMMGETKNIKALVAKTVALSLLVAAVSCNQTIPILVLGATLLQRFSSLSEGRPLLVKTMLDSTLVMPVLVPWNGLAMVMSVTLGVPTLEALPYLFFPLLLPLLTIITSRQDLSAGSLIVKQKNM